MANPLESGFPAELKPSLTAGAQIIPADSGGWRLEIPAGPARRYRLAQWDDYCGLPRRRFRWGAPFHLSLEARASSADIPGTWGFGVWNDPFGMALPGGRRGLYFPALPQSAWYFFAAPPNYLSLRDDLPAQGFLAATFRSWSGPIGLLSPGALALPLLVWPAAARLLRRLARRFVRQSGAGLAIEPHSWHAYELFWDVEQVRFVVDGVETYATPIVPHGPLGLVIWVDNQYAAFTPQGRVRYGYLAASQPAWIEIRKLDVQGAGANRRLTRGVHVGKIVGLCGKKQHV